MKTVRLLAILIMLIGVGSIGVGGIFIQQSFWVKDQLMTAIVAQRITSTGDQEEFILDESKLNDPPTKTVVVPPTGNQTSPTNQTVITPPGTVKVLDTKIVGIIDTPEEARMMANTLMTHLMVDYPPYSVLKNNSTYPNDRQTLLNGLSMATALNLAQMGLGVSTIALGVGCFMITTGIGFGLIGVYLWRRTD